MPDCLPQRNKALSHQTSKLHNKWPPSYYGEVWCNVEGYWNQYWCFIVEFYAELECVLAVCLECHGGHLEQINLKN